MRGRTIIIEQYTAERVPNPHSRGKLPWQLYHSARNAVVRCCRRFGKVGPMGECPITDEKEIPFDRWPLGDPEPLDFLVIDDQYNDDRYVYLEIVRPAPFTERWLRGLMQMLKRYPGWGVGVMGWSKAYMVVFADRLMVTGRAFESCGDLKSVIRLGRGQLEKRRGPSRARRSTGRRKSRWRIVE
jgi:hypothetical protein